MEGSRGDMEHEAACRDCHDEGAVYFVGEIYCGRCALERLIRALQAEIADDPVEEPSAPAIHLVES